MHDQLVVVVVEHHAAISDYFFFFALRLSSFTVIVRLTKVVGKTCSICSVYSLMLLW